MTSFRKRVKTMNNASSVSWSNEDYKLQDFIEKFELPQVVKVKKDGTKCSALKSSAEIVLHESRTVKKVEACVANRQLVIPYDCPAKLYQLSKAEEYSTIGELRKALPICRYILVTSKPKAQQLNDLQPSEVLTIVFKKNVNGSEVFICQRKKSGEINVPASAVGGFAPMATTKESKISDFVRPYSTFPIGIGLSESTLANKSFNSLNQIVSSAESGLIRLTRLYDRDVVIASSTGRKKTMFSITKDADITVTAPKTNEKYTELCKQLHSAVDSSLTHKHLGLIISTDKESEVLKWSYGEESTYDDVVPLRKRSDGAGEAKRDVQKKTIDKETTETKETTKMQKSKDKAKDKGKEKSKDKEIVKDKEKVKDKGKVRKKLSEEKRQDEKEAAELVEDDSGYLIPAELLRAANNKDIKVLKGEDEIPESKEKSSKAKATTLGRFMEKVKGKEKKKERPASEILSVNIGDDNAKSSSMPYATKKAGFTKNKAKTLSTIDIDLKSNHDDIDAGSEATPCEKDQVKRREKGIFTTGKKAGARLRNKLGISKVIDDDQSAAIAKPDSPPASHSPPASYEDPIQDMYVSPVEDQIPRTLSNTVQDRPLPDCPKVEDRKVSTAPSIPLYDDEDLYDEINPMATFKIPKDLTKLTVDGVSDMLRYLNMHEHVSKFRRDQIDGEILMSLDEKLLGALGVADAIQRHKLKKLLKGWRPKK